jgi:hypothetical protein
VEPKDSSTVLAGPAAADVQRMLDEREIERVIYRYCRGSDRCDEELLTSVYHDDAIDDHGDLFRGPALEFIPMVIDLLRSRFRSTMHLVGNIHIELHGDRADVDTYCLAQHVTAGDDPALRVFGCRYVDKFERRPGVGWRILHRTVVAEWQAENDRGLYPLPPGMPVGARDRTDLSYS